MDILLPSQQQLLLLIFYANNNNMDGFFFAGLTSFTNEKSAPYPGRMSLSTTFDLIDHEIKLINFK